MNEKLEFEAIVQIVKKHVKGTATAEERSYLEKEVGLGLWRGALVSAINDINEQFLGKKTASENLLKRYQVGLVSKSAYKDQSEMIDEWRKKATRYKMGLEDKLQEIKAIEREQNVSATEYRYKYEQILKAVGVHKQTKPKATTSDKELWQAVEDLTANNLITK